jgi:transcriptional regulator with XRE-family HTH domain
VNAPEPFGRNLFMARRRQGLSRERLADMAGVHRDTIYWLERGERNPQLFTIRLLARALDVKASELVDGSRL